jgi:hypothetical protein
MPTRTKTNGGGGSGESDPGFDYFQARLRYLDPTISDADLGHAWMRVQSARENPDRPRYTGSLPDLYPPVANSVMVCIILAPDGAALSCAVKCFIIDSIVAVWRENEAVGGTRKGLQNAIAAAMLAGKYHEDSCAHDLLMQVMALAFTGPAAARLRRQAEAGYLRLTFRIDCDTDDSGRPTFRFRLSDSDQRERLTRDGLIGPPRRSRRRRTRRR